MSNNTNQKQETQTVFEGTIFALQLANVATNVAMTAVAVYAGMAAWEYIKNSR